MPRPTHPSRSPLRSRRFQPMKGTSLMTITGLSLPTPVTPATNGTRPAASTPSHDDQVAMSISADTFSSFVQEAGQVPDVRSELVDMFKSRIQSGGYPTSETLDGLTDKLADAWPSLSAAVSQS